MRQAGLEPDCTLAASMGFFAAAVVTGALEIDEALAAVIRQADLVTSLYRIGTVSEPAQARAALQRAIAIVDALAKRGALNVAQQAWPQFLRGVLAKLPPETAGAP